MLNCGSCDIVLSFSWTARLLWIKEIVSILLDESHILNTDFEILSTANKLLISNTLETNKCKNSAY